MIKRREFISLLGGAAAWPLAARGQQPAVPVIGYLYEGWPEPTAQLLAAFRNGLSETGYVEGRNVTIEFRWALGQYDRLPELAVELVRRRVAVIVAPGGMPAALAVKAATTTIPIVFGTGGDPERTGLVASLNRPGGNVTGVSAMNVEQSDLRAAVSSIGRELEVLTAKTNHDINVAFATLVQKRADALFINGDAFFTSRVVQLATLAVHHRVPAIYALRDFVMAGGLMSYGASFADMFRQVGIYAGRVLKGEKPADLPVLQATKFELVINAQTAKMLGLTVPDKLLATADEIIE
jgi:putative ABC transport system substrate-binding protein